ncbi:hypothetical protein ACTG9Q_15515 [Actinokineospora sp. 24-640]
MIQRYLRPAGLNDVDGWTVKVYHLNVDDADIPVPFLEAGSAAMPSLLPRTELLPPVGERFGFSLLHRTADTFWNILYTWVDGTNLHLRASSVPLDAPDQPFAPMTDPFVGCVWELPVVTHERASWVRHVVEPDGPDHEAYLADRLSGLVGAA